MKSILNCLMLGVASVIGINAGIWLWDEVLEDKLDDLKDHFNKKKEKES